MSSDLSNFSMLDLFRSEMETHLKTLNQGLIEAERTPTSKPLLESLMRAAHSIKGAARIVQIQTIVKVAHVLEDFFVEVLNGKVKLQAEHNDALLKALDFMEKIGVVSEGDLKAWESANAEEAERLIEQISAAAKPEDISAISPGAPIEEVSIAPAVKAPESPVAEATDLARSVRIHAENLDRIIGLSGESMVSANWLRPFANNLNRLKAAHDGFEDILERFSESLQSDSLAEASQTQLKELRRKAEELRELISQRLSEFENYWYRSRNISNRLYREALSSRMRPFAEGVEGFARMVRDVSRNLKKKVQFEIFGKATPVDRDILQKLEAPLNHLIRNAIDHGIEFPEERIAKGKPAEGTVRLEAAHRAGMLHVAVSDDGRGIDYAHLRQKLLEKKMASQEMVSQMSEKELMEFLFLPGFSTSGTVSEISGRGFGLDIVATLARELGGVLETSSQEGKGMTIQLQLPLTLSVVRSLLVLISGEPYALPLSRIERTLLVHRSEIRKKNGEKFIERDAQQIPLIPGDVLLDLPKTDQENEELPVVVIGDHGNRYGLIVERFLTQSQVVVRPLDRRLGKIQDLNSVAFLQDGSLALVIDVPDLLYSINNFLSRARKDQSLFRTAEVARKKRILVVDDSLTVREVERKILESGGYEVEIAVDGLHGWNAVRTAHFDLMITDVDMPHLNGTELVTRIKQDSRLRHLPVVMISYKDRDEDKQKGIQAGANYYLSKNNFDQETLLQAVKHLLGENR